MNKAHKRFLALRRRVMAAIKKALEIDPGCKSYEGAMELLIEYPNYFELNESEEDTPNWYEYFRYGSYNRMFRTYGIGYQYNGNWAGDAAFGHKARVLAWMPLPDPPKGQKVGCSK